MRQDMEQLGIEVPPAPNAIARWDTEHEIEAYRRAHGDAALRRQRALALKAKECTCGQQTASDIVRKAEGKKPKRLVGNQHKPGCNSYTRPALSLAISEAGQVARYEEQRADTREES